MPITPNTKQTEDNADAKDDKKVVTKREEDITKETPKIVPETENTLDSETETNPSEI